MSKDELLKKIKGLQEEINQASYQYGELGKAILVMNGKLKAYSEMLDSLSSKKK